jgi:hypothetical protein
VSESFDIVLSKLLDPCDFAAGFAELIPAGLRVDVRRDLSEFPDEPGAIWAMLGSTDDPAWPCILKVLVCRDECKLGPYPDLRVAVVLWERFGADALCGTYSFAGELDPYDPYWSLAYISGSWYLASTCGTRLMGPYTDGVREFPGDGAIKLVRPVVVPDTLHGEPGAQVDGPASTAFEARSQTSRPAT